MKRVVFYAYLAPYKLLIDILLHETHQSVVVF